MTNDIRKKSDPTQSIPNHQLPLHRLLKPSCGMTPAFSMTATSSKAILRASVGLVLLPLALGFAPAISTMHLPASGNRHALSRGPPAVTMIARAGDTMRAGETMLGQRQRENSSRRATAVLRTALATVAAVCLLGSSRPASAFADGGAMSLLAADVPAMQSEGLSTSSKVDARVAVPQDFKKTTKKELMAMEVKAMHSSFGTSAIERFRDFMLKALFFGASLAVVPWYVFGRKSDMTENGASGGLMYEYRSKSMLRSKTMYGE